MCKTMPRKVLVDEDPAEERGAERVWNKWNTPAASVFIFGLIRRLELRWNCPTHLLTAA
jgi:hypothetical protein